MPAMYLSANNEMLHLVRPVDPIFCQKYPVLLPQTWLENFPPLKISSDFTHDT